MPEYVIRDGRGRELFVNGPQAPSKYEAKALFDRQDKQNPTWYADVHKEDRTPEGNLAEFGKGALRGFINTNLSAVSGLASTWDRVLGKDLAVDGNALISSLDKAQSWIREDSPISINPIYEGGKADTFGSAIGSVGAFIGPSGYARVAAGGLKLVGAAGKAAALADKANKIGWYGGMTLGVGSGADEQRIRMEQQIFGENEEVSVGQQRLATALGLGIGASEMLPLERWLRGIPADSKSLVKVGDIIKQGVTGVIAQGAIEGGQEAAASLAQDFAEKLVYNPEVEVGKTMWDEFQAGAFAGALLDGVGTGYQVASRYHAIKELYAREKELRLNAAENAKEIPDPPTMAQQQRQYMEEQTSQVKTETDKLNQPDRSTYKVAGKPDLANEARKLRRLEGSNFPRPKVPYTQNTSVPNDLSPDTEFIVDIGPVKDSQSGKSKTPRWIARDSQGNQWGDLFTNRAKAAEWAYHLNNQVYKGQVEELIQDSVGVGEGVNRDDSGLIDIGTQILDPEYNSISADVVDELGETTIGTGYDQGVSVVEKKKRRDKKNTYTASQQINKVRVENGLPETSKFTVAEVRAVLGDKIGTMSDLLSDAEVQLGNDQPLGKFKPFQTKKGSWLVVDEKGKPAVTDRETSPKEQDRLTLEGRKRVKTTELSERDATNIAKLLGQNYGDYTVQNRRFGKSKITADKIGKLLEQKNIISKTNSKEMKTIYQAIVGKDKLSSMNDAEKRLVFNRVKSFPTLVQPSRLPVFDREYVLQRREQLTKKPEQKEKKVNEEKKPLAVNSAQKARLIANLNGFFKSLAPNFEPAYILQNSLSIAGISSDGQYVEGVRLAREGESFVPYGETPQEGDTRPVAYDPEGKFVKEDSVFTDEIAVFHDGIQKILLSVDNAEKLARERNGGRTPSIEQVEAALVEQLTHETIHMMRYLDLWKPGEWDFLNRMTHVKKNAQGYTYWDAALGAYSSLPRYKNNQDMIEEEAVVALIVDAKTGNPQLLTGKAHGLVGRLINFLKRIRNYMQGNGYNSFQDIVDSYYSGEIGSRDAGEIRTDRFGRRANSKLVARYANQQGLDLLKRDSESKVKLSPKTADEREREDRARRADFDIEPVTTEEQEIADLPAMYIGPNAGPEAFVHKNAVVNDRRESLNPDLPLEEALRREMIRATKGDARSIDPEVREATRINTGWFIGNDNMARFEVSDYTAEVNNDFWFDMKPYETEYTQEEEGGDIVETTDPANGVKLSELLDHDVLYKAYPKLKDVTIYKEANSVGLGRYSPLENAIYLGDINYPEIPGFEMPGAEREEYNGIPVGPGLLKATLLHEIQHWIQFREGFATGGDPMSAATMLNLLPSREQNLLIKKGLERLMAKARHERAVGKTIDSMRSDSELINYITSPAFIKEIAAKRDDQLLISNLKFVVRRHAPDTTDGLNAVNTVVHRLINSAYLLPNVQQRLFEAETQESPDTWLQQAFRFDLKRKLAGIQQRYGNNASIVTRERFIPALLDVMDKGVQVVELNEQSEDFLNKLPKKDAELLEEQAVRYAAVIESGLNHDIYQRLAGEVESRDVEYRINQTVWDRLGESPLESQEFGRREVIVRHADASEIEFFNKAITDLRESIAEAPGYTDADLVAKIPPNMMRRIQVNVPVIIDGNVTTEPMNAKEAIAETQRELDAYQNLLNCVRGG
jgi:hypothetical protein